MPHIILPCLKKTGTWSFEFSNNNHQDVNSLRPGIHLKLYTKLQFSLLLMFREIISTDWEYINHSKSIMWAKCSFLGYSKWYILVKGNKWKHNLLLGYVMVIVIIILTEVCCLISEFKQSNSSQWTICSWKRRQPAPLKHIYFLLYTVWYPRTWTFINIPVIIYNLVQVTCMTETAIYWPLRQYNLHLCIQCIKQVNTNHSFLLPF